MQLRTQILDCKGVQCSPQHVASPQGTRWSGPGPELNYCRRRRVAAAATKVATATATATPPPLRPSAPTHCGEGDGGDDALTLAPAQAATVLHVAQPRSEWLAYGTKK